MLAMQYVLEIVKETIGRNSMPELNFVTDSAAAKSIRQKNIEDFQSNRWLDQEMAIESEIRRMEIASGIRPTEIVWTKSHIETNTAKDPYLTHMNDMADSLSTLARDKVESEPTHQVVHGMFPGSRIALLINGYVVHNN